MVLVVDGADVDTLGAESGLRGAGEEDEDVLVFCVEVEEGTEHCEAEACGCSGKGYADHGEVLMGKISGQMRLLVLKKIWTSTVYSYLPSFWLFRRDW